MANLGGASSGPGTGSNVAPRDRKLSQEYFKEESRRLDQRLKGLLQTQNNSVDE